MIWQSAAAASEKIASALAEKKVDGVPDLAETIHLAAHALQSQVKVESPDRQADLADACRLAARIADDVIAAAWANDAAKTDTAYQRVKLALGIVQRNLPTEIANAAPQPVRFAKKERRDSTGKK